MHITKFQRSFRSLNNPKIQQPSLAIYNIDSSAILEENQYLEEEEGELHPQHQQHRHLDPQDEFYDEMLTESLFLTVIRIRYSSLLGRAVRKARPYWRLMHRPNTLESIFPVVPLFLLFNAFTFGVSIEILIEDMTEDNVPQTYSKILLWATCSTLSMYIAFHASLLA